MKKLTMLHNPKCSKSRETLQILNAKKAQVEVIEYLKTPPSKKMLSDLIDQLGLDPSDIVRTKEDLFSDLKLDKNPPKTRQGWIEVLVENPILIERPIVTNGKKAVLGRPPENVLGLLK